MPPSAFPLCHHVASFSSYVLPVASIFFISYFREVISCLLRVHGSLSAVTLAPFHVSTLRPASQAGLMHESAGLGKLVNAVLLSLIIIIIIEFL